MLIEKITQENAATAEESAAAAEVFKEQAIFISSIVQELEKLVNGTKLKNTLLNEKANKSPNNIDIKKVGSKGINLEAIPFQPKKDVINIEEFNSTVKALEDDKQDF